MNFRKALIGLVFCSSITNGDISPKSLEHGKILEFGKEVKIFQVNPQIKGIEIHRFEDSNKNGIYDIPEETIQILKDDKTPHDLYVRKLIPAKGKIGIFVSGNRYQGKVLDFEFEDSDNPPDRRFILGAEIKFTNDSTDLLFFDPENYRKDFERMNGFPPQGVRRYRLNCYNNEGLLGDWCSFGIDYGRKD